MRVHGTKLGAISTGRGLGDQLYDLAGQVPPLDLNFAGTKTLDPRITFTRASSGTYVDSAGVIQTASTNVPRFDHNPTTGESLGLLVEEQRTNLCLYSQAISTAPWAANGLETCVASTLTDPAGGLDAFRINTPGSGSFERWQQPITVVNGTTYTLSAWVRSTTGTTQFRLRFTGGTASPDLTATTTWQRFSFTLTAGTTAGFFAFNAPSSGAATEIHVYGAQLEAAAFPTSYIPTTTAAATRSADVASITGTAFSGWYNQTEGSFFCSTTAPKGNVIFGTGDTFDNTQYATVGASNNISIRSGGSDQAILTAPVSSSANTNIALGYASNSFAAVSNGGTVTADTSGAVPLSQVRLKLGSSAWDTSGGNNINGTIKRLAYWPQRLPNSTLQAITQP